MLLECDEVDTSVLIEILRLGIIHKVRTYLGGEGQDLGLQNCAAL